ncbi:MAG TPA: 3-oxoacyl-[acyl-carrier-protein] synthase III C-terminal domain-containing protein, partial [Verrucomicrobiae bacterium]|nr:3-oxoacyl-[acyl-carrier-protein] synthase III C-terminal domain-containing protein [Verrucomicrobiae bacterium]
VPLLAGQHAKKVFRDTLACSNPANPKINGWVLHSGGRDVLTALREKFELTVRDTHWSEVVLREFGNVSSPSVFFVLERALNDSVPGGFWWMSSFGAGFSCHGALLQVE